MNVTGSGQGPILLCAAAGQAHDDQPVSKH